MENSIKRVRNMKKSKRRNGWNDTVSLFYPYFDYLFGKVDYPRYTQPLDNTWTGINIAQYQERQWNNYTGDPHLPSTLAIAMATTDANLHTKIFVAVNWTSTARNLIQVNATKWLEGCNAERIKLHFSNQTLGKMIQLNGQCDAEKSSFVSQKIYLKYGYRLVY